VRRLPVVAFVVIFASVVTVVATAVAGGANQKGLVTQPTPKAVVAEHLDALPRLPS
jgi:hypothetical protein